MRGPCRNPVWRNHIEDILGPGFLIKVRFNLVLQWGDIGRLVAVGDYGSFRFCIPPRENQKNNEKF